MAWDFSGIGDFFQGIAQHRQRQLQQAGLALQTLIDIYGRGNVPPDAMRGALEQYRSAAKNAGFNIPFPMEPGTPPQTTSTGVNPMRPTPSPNPIARMFGPSAPMAPQIPRGPSMPGPTPDTPSQPQPPTGGFRPPTPGATTTSTPAGPPQIMLPPQDPGQLPLRAVVKDPATLRFIQDNYPQYLNAPYSKAIADIPGLKERLARLSYGPVSAQGILAGLTFKPGQEANARATVESLMAQGEYDPQKLRAAVKDFVEVPQSSPQLQDYARGRIDTANKRLQDFDTAIRQASTAGNFDEVNRLVQRRNQYLADANAALGKDETIKKSGITFSGLNTQPYGESDVAQFTEGPKRKEALQNARDARADALAQLAFNRDTRSEALLRISERRLGILESKQGGGGADATTLPEVFIDQQGRSVQLRFRNKKDGTQIPEKLVANHWVTIGVPEYENIVNARSAAAKFDPEEKTRFATAKKIQQRVLVEEDQMAHPDKYPGVDQDKVTAQLNADKVRLDELYKQHDKWVKTHPAPKTTVFPAAQTPSKPTSPSGAKPAVTPQAGNLPPNPQGFVGKQVQGKDGKWYRPKADGSGWDPVP